MSDQAQATQATPAAATPAEAAQTTPQAKPSADQILAAAAAKRQAFVDSGGRAPDASGAPVASPVTASETTEPTGASDAATEEARTLPEPTNQNQINAQRRIKERAEKRKRDQLAAEEANAHQARIDKLQAELESERAFKSEFLSAKEKRDIQQLVKLGGFDSFEDAQKAFLEQKGALPQKDPKVAELEQRLAKFEQEKAEAERQRQAQEQAWREQQEERQLLSHLTEEASAHYSPQVAQFAQLAKSGSHIGDAFMRQAYQELVRNPDLDMDQAYANVEANWRRDHEVLSKVYGSKESPPHPAGEQPESASNGSRPSPQRTEEKAGRTAPTTLSPSESAAAEDPIDFDPSDIDAHREAVRRRLFDRLGI